MSPHYLPLSLGIISTSHYNNPFFPSQNLPTGESVQNLLDVLATPALAGLVAK